MPDVTIREATPTDAAALARVYRSAYRENRTLGFPAKAEEATAETVGEWIDEHHVLVAIEDGSVVGGARLEVTDPDRVKLSRVAVHEDRKGEGIGTQLLDRAEALVGEWGHDVVWLTTPPEHPYLPDLYRARGYDETAPYPLEYREYDEVVMEQRLE